MRARSTTAGRVVILVEPIRELRETKRRILERQGCEVLAVPSLPAAFAALARPGVSLVLLDLPEGESMWVGLDAMRARHGSVPVIVMQTVPRVEHAVEAMRRGASDYLAKSLDPEALSQAVRSTLQLAAVVQPPAVLELIELSAAMRSVMDQVRRVGPSDASIVLLGESGVGKEIVARYIHRISPRASREFVAINCATLAEDILENELFGHERGAFTSADAPKAGMFELADGGTLFLDELSEMGLRCQAKVLRAVERKEFRRVGGTKKVKVDLRIIAATSSDLSAAVGTRRFREDLYYRLNVVTLRIPALRDRREVIPDMARRFVAEYAAKTHRRVLSFSLEALAKLAEYDWPGNVRELRNVIESLVLTVPGSRIELRDLPPTIHEETSRRDLSIAVGLTMPEIEREIFLAYVRAYGSKKAAAKALQIPLRTFHGKAKRLGL